MKWTLVKINQETDHPFLNYFTLSYDVEKNDGHHSYNYFMASRRSKENLRPYSLEYKKADGVIIPTIYENHEDGKVYFLFTKQFRPAINKYVYSVPAGLVDDDEDIETTARREVEEEGGAKVYSTEILSYAAPTSSGLSDEFNAVVLAKVNSFSKTNLEEFEEITSELVPLDKAEEFIESHFFALQPKFIVKYLIEKYQSK